MSAAQRLFIPSSCGCDGLAVAVPGFCTERPQLCREHLVSRSPCFSGDGKYLFFVSNRDFNPTLGQTEFNFVYLDMARIFFVTLAKDTPSPFKPLPPAAMEAFKRVARDPVRLL